MNERAACRAPLSGIRVVDMSTVVFGPYCTQILADLGADVIKIEPKGGDNVRGIGKPPRTPLMGPMHLRLNRGKRSVYWDLKSEAGRALVGELLRTADVFLHNILPDAVARLGLSYEDVRKLRPDIVYVHCTGFGLEGPYAGLPAYDDVIQAAAGTAAFLPRADGNPKPRFLPTLFADKVSGLHAVYATQAALLHRERTGEGQFVEVPMFEVLASFNMLEHLGNATYIPATGPWGYPRQLDPARQPIRTTDGYIAIAPYTDERWVRFFEVTGHAAELTRPELADVPSRKANVGLMYRRAHEIMADRSTDEWIKVMRDAGIPAIRVTDVEELLRDPHLRATGLLRDREHPTEGAYIEVAQPVRFSRHVPPPSRPAPTLGEHTAEIERELGAASGDRGPREG